MHYFSKIDLHKGYNPPDVQKRPLQHRSDPSSPPAAIPHEHEAHLPEEDRLGVADIEAAFDYLDQLIMFGKSSEEHEGHFWQAFARQQNTRPGHKPGEMCIWSCLHQFLVPQGFMQRCLPTPLNMEAIEKFL